MTLRGAVGEADERARSRPVGELPWCGCVLQDIAAAVLWETNEGRTREHRSSVGGRCDARFVVVGRELLRNGSLVGSRSRWACPQCGAAGSLEERAELRTSAMFELSGECICCSYLSDALVSALQYLTSNRATILDPPAAARRHVRLRQHDHIREARRARGAQTRTDRLATGAIGRRLSTENQRMLLVDLADEAGSDAPLESNEHLLRRLAVLRSRRTGEAPDSLLLPVRADYLVVRAACEQGRRINVGTCENPELVTWWEAYIDRPLGRRRRLSDIPIEEHGSVQLAQAEENRSIEQALVDAVQRRLRSHADVPVEDLLEYCVAEIAGAGLADRRRVAAFRMDEARRAEALSALAEVVATHRAFSQVADTSDFELDVLVG